MLSWFLAGQLPFSLRTVVESSGFISSSWGSLTSAKTSTHSCFRFSALSEKRTPWRWFDPRPSAAAQQKGTIASSSSGETFTLKKTPGHDGRERWKGGERENKQMLQVSKDWVVEWTGQFLVSAVECVVRYRFGLKGNTSVICHLLPYNLPSSQFLRRVFEAIFEVSSQRSWQGFRWAAERLFKFVHTCLVQNLIHSGTARTNIE